MQLIAYYFYFIPPPGVGICGAVLCAKMHCLHPYCTRGCVEDKYAFIVPVTWLDFNQWHFSISDDEIASNTVQILRVSKVFNYLDLHKTCKKYKCWQKYLNKVHHHGCSFILNCLYAIKLYFIYKVENLTVIIDDQA